MTQTKMKKFKHTLLFLIIGFVLLFAFRLIYGYTTTNPEDLPFQSQFFENFDNLKKNYSSKEYKHNNDNISQAPVTVDQKYEKIADINTTSKNFEADEKEARTHIEKSNALIQYEQKSGNKGYRTLNLVIGVPPKNFDSLYNCLIKIGKVQAKQITKTDKTNEYKELNAKKASLEKIRTSLIDLKTKGGKIQEYMELENRILEIEQQLQGLGVSLGDFDAENEFCTVKFSMAEGQEKTISFTHRLKVAFEWTVKLYLRIIAIAFFVALFAYLLLLVIEKLKILEAIIKRKE
jgi:hypothetical protein